ncbi:MAG: hypothetical protein IIA88_03540 [Bacteroidetes bacterium]|nr:hypothetical protein [Bacteroidota bacterium]
MMKRFFNIILIITFIGCVDNRVEPNESSEFYKPLLMHRSELENSIELRDKRDINNPTKIYLKDNYIFITEKYYGVHIIDNSDPKNPANIGFISVPGCVDVAIKQNIMYVDNATDLVAIDLSDYNNLKEVKRIKDAFPELYPPDNNNWIPNEYKKENRPENTVIVAWVKTN